MNRLARYVAWTVLSAIVGVLLALLALDLLFSFLAELDSLSAQYHMKDALLQVMLHIPGTVYEMIPVACLIGVLTGLGILSSHSELTVMRAAGLSPLRIVLYTFIPAVFFAAACLVLAQWVVPVAERRAQALKSLALGEHVVSGYWHREGNQFVHVVAVRSQQQLQGVDFYSYNPQDVLISVGHAQTARFNDGVWQLNDWQESQVAASMRVSSRQLTQALWTTRLTPEFLQMAAVEPELQSPSQLYAYSHYLQRQGLESASWQLEFWKKMMQPLATLVMVLLAATMLFGPLRSVTMGLRLISGVFVGLGFRYGQDFFGFASLIYHFSTFWGAALPGMLALCAGMVFMLRVR